jgi:hypothetical protein
MINPIGFVMDNIEGMPQPGVPMEDPQAQQDNLLRNGGGRPTRRGIRGDGLLTEHLTVTCAKIVVWPKENITKVAMYDRLFLITTNPNRPTDLSLFGKIQKIEKIRQRNNILRFDIYVTREYCEAIIRRMRRNMYYKWHVRMHKQYYSRNNVRLTNRNQQPQGTDSGANRNLLLQTVMEVTKVASVNINSSRDKLWELEMYIKDTGTSILALQETKKDNLDWHQSIRGYKLFEVLATKGAPGKNGLALYVKQELGAWEISSSPYHIFIEIVIHEIRWYIFNIYFDNKYKLYFLYYWFYYMFIGFS